MHFADHDVRAGKKLTLPVSYTSAMFPRPKFLLIALVAMLATACGLKGPLYRPDEPPSDKVTPVEDSTTGKKKPGDTAITAPTTDPDRPATPPDR